MCAIGDRMDFDNGRTRLNVRRFVVSDLEEIEEPDDVSAVKNSYRVRDAIELMMADHSYTIYSDDGIIMACAGVHTFWEGYGLCWAFVSAKVKPHMSALVWVMKDFLERVPFHRLEAAVDVDFRNGHRLMRALGFQREGVMRKYTVDKRDHVLYSIVKDD